MATGTINSDTSGDWVYVPYPERGVTMITSLSSTITAVLEYSPNKSDAYPVRSSTEADTELQFLLAAGWYRYTATGTSGGEFDWFIGDGFPEAAQA